jgi:acetylglutamate kinase
VWAYNLTQAFLANRTVTDMTDSAARPAIARQDRADILASALPALRRNHGKTMVIKYGGNAMTDPALQQAFAEDVVMLQLAGIRAVVVHGGGPQIEQLLQRLGKQGTFIQGMRVTDAETMSVVEWVLGGQVQQTIVGLINQAGGRAMGMTGRDGATIQAQRLRLVDSHNLALVHDVGQVGDVVSVDTRALVGVLDAGMIPVVSPIGYGASNESYNINADVVASELAKALHAEKLLMMTNIAGVLDQAGQLLPELSPARIDALCADGTISGGMIPKIAGALDAAKSGVQAVHILDGRVPHALLLEVLGNEPFGTTIRAQ